MSLPLSELLKDLGATRIGSGDPDIESIGIHADRVGPGGLFIAIEGERRDGHDFVDAAIRAGARALLLERKIPVPTGIAAALVPNTRACAPIVASRFFGEPSRKMTVVGVTGTNGKTTCTWLLDAIAAAAGRRTGLIGTVGVRWGGVSRPAAHTTPDPVALQELLATMAKADVEHVSLEVSSHALAQHRADAIDFRAALFTQLGRDHLDYHQTPEAYFQAKARLFSDLMAHGRTNDKTAIINIDDPAGRRLKDISRADVTLGVSAAGRPDAAIRVIDADLRPTGTTFTLASPWGRHTFTSPLVGRFNLDNLAGVTGLALALQIPAERIRHALREAQGAPGRLEPIRAGGPSAPRVFVDYAHDAHSLEAVLRTLRALEPRHLIVVFGCGGDRDPGKRPIMGEVAARLADLSVITSDNPRSENPKAILDAIRSGMSAAAEWPGHFDDDSQDIHYYHVIDDRRHAMAEAIRIAGQSDIVLIAGRGHEAFQILGNERRPFDDRRVAARILSGEEGGAG